MNLKTENGTENGTEHGGLDEKHGENGSPYDSNDRAAMAQGQNVLHRNLKGRHMQFIAIGGAIGAGLFIGSASAFTSGGPGSVVVGFLIVGIMVYLMMQALAEMSVIYPVNGAFTLYICRFVDPSFGFACAWEYAISWLTVLPFEISAACNIIHYWPGSKGINNSAWIVPILVALVVIQIFGVRGYGEVEFVLSLMKVIACVGFIILGVIIDVGGVPTDHRGYIGARYWHAPHTAFLNGFQGFCGVFVTAAFAYTGTELTGLAAAETANPRREIPRASKQVVWRILIFYVVNLFLVGLIVPAGSKALSASGAESRHSPFVIAIQLAGIKGLPSVFNAVILISVLSVANSCTFGSTRTIQALASNGMAPNFLAYIDNKGRPLVVVVVQLLFGCLAFLNLAPNGGTIFTWLLSLSGLSILFIYGGIALAHIRFRLAWKANGHTLEEIPYRAQLGVYGSYVCLLINIVALMAQFYTALYPVGGPTLSVSNFFEDYLAGPLLIFLYLCWKIYSWFVRPEDRPLYIKIKDIDIYTGMRDVQVEISGRDVPEDQRRASIDELHRGEKKGVGNFAMGVVRSIF